MIKRLEFVCPDCKYDEIEEVMGNCIVSSVIILDGETAIDDFPDYGESTTHYGEVDRYQCVKCGFVIKTNTTQDGISSGSSIVNPDELREWLIATRDERGEG